jgi:hypothetical protein
MFLMPRGHFLVEIPAWPEELLAIRELHVVVEVTLLLKGFSLRTKLPPVGKNPCAKRCPPNRLFCQQHLAKFG